MDINSILKLATAGFTKDEIFKLASMESGSETGSPANMQELEKDKTASPELGQVLEAVNSLKSVIQGNNIVTLPNSVSPTAEADDITKLVMGVLPPKKENV